MPDKADVIKRIERLIEESAVEDGMIVYPVFETLKALKDARDLLKAQEPVKPQIETWNDERVEEKTPTVGGWISVKDRLPAETHSIFYPWFGKKQWNKAMWSEQSDKVLVTVAFEDGTRTVTTGETHDGIWHTSFSRILEHVVTHWMPLPEPPKEGEQ